MWAGDHRLDDPQAVLAVAAKLLGVERVSDGRVSQHRHTHGNVFVGHGEATTPSLVQDGHAPVGGGKKRVGLWN